MFESVFASQVTIACFAGLLLAAAASDVMTYKIPNAIVLGIILLYGIFVQVMPGEVDWLMGLAVFAGAIAVGMVLSALGKFGAGDAKLLAAVLLWAGPSLSPLAVLICAIVGGVLSVIMLTSARFIFAGAFSSLGSQTLSNLFLAKSMPYGVAIAAGGLFVAWVLMTSV